jgi:hypothetical protein
VKYWEIIAYDLTYAGWSWNYTSNLTARGETIFALMRIATMENVTLFSRMNYLLDFSKWSGFRAR